MKRESRRDLQLLNEIEGREDLTQRHLAKKLGIAVGLTNLYLKRLARKGYIKIVNLQRNRIRYLITPQGILEKTRLTYEYMAYSLQLYRDARRLLRERFRDLADRGRKRIVLYGTGEAAELAYLALREMELTLVGVVDEGNAGRRFLGHPVLDPGRLAELEYDQVVVTDFADGAAAAEGLRARGIPPERIACLTPR